MDYDKIFGDDIRKKLLYTDYPGSKLMVGKISLKNALSRLDKHEYYVLVTYGENEKLPVQYVPLAGYENEEGDLFATINPDVHLDEICRDGGIQKITRLPDFGSNIPRYLLGPGPETVTLDDLIMEQYTLNYEKQTGKSR